METEITVQVFDDFETIKNKVSEHGFRLVREKKMYDKYFSRFSLNKLRTMKYKNVIANSFLIRSFADDDATLVYKNKVVKGNTVVMEEKIKTKIDSVQSAKQIFEMAGLSNWCNLMQDMFIFSDGTTELAVQVVENLGIFIEYEEDESVKNLALKEKLSKMKEKLLGLGLNLGEDFGCKKPYMMLHK